MKNISDKDYTINNHSTAAEEQYRYDMVNDDEEGLYETDSDGAKKLSTCMPYRLGLSGAFNIRGQSTTSYYQINLGDQRC